MGADGDIAADADAALRRVGDAVRSIRLRRRLTLDHLAEQAAVSKGHLSRFERGEKAMSIAALMRLAQALGTSVSDLMGVAKAPDPVRVVRAADRSVSHAPRAEGRYAFSLLSRSGRQAAVEIFTAEITADQEMRPHVTHGGHESFLVLSGRIEMEIGDQRLELEPGDFVDFSARLQHAVRSTVACSHVLVIIEETGL